MNKLLTKAISIKERLEHVQKNNDMGIFEGRVNILKEASEIANTCSMDINYDKLLEESARVLFYDNCLEDVLKDIAYLSCTVDLVLENKEQAKRVSDNLDYMHTDIDDIKYTGEDLPYEFNIVMMESIETITRIIGIFK